MTLLDPVDLGPPDFIRDQWQRPLIVPPDGGKPRPYTRSSTAAKTVEDTWNLELWARRNVAFGMARDRSLVARVLALAGDPSTWSMETKKLCNQIVEDATEVALARRAADEGIALHRMTELRDRGIDVFGGAYEADLEAYTNALIEAGLSIVEVECRLVCDELKMAGTADRILQRTSDRMHLIADIKTGETVDYGGLGWAAQLAAYAHSQLYDVDAGERLETPNLDKTTGIIIHLQAGQGRCTLYEIDLVAGYRAAQLANEIRAVRNAAQAMDHPDDRNCGAGATGLRPADGGRWRRERLLDRYQKLTLPRRNAFRDRHLDRDDLDAIEAALDELDPPPVDPLMAEVVALEAWRDRVAPKDSPAKKRLDAIAAQAGANGAIISFYFEPFDRNFHLCRALLACCESDIGDEGLREMVEAVLDTELDQTITTGAALGALTVAEAERLDEMASAAVP